MRDRFVFGAASLAVSFALYGVAAYAQASGYYAPSSVGFLVAALAVILCALGVSWTRKVVFAGSLLVAFVAFDLAMAAFGLRGTALGGGAPPPRFGPAVALFFAAVPLALPLAALAVFVGRDPGVLWTRSSSRARVKPRAR